MGVAVFAGAGLTGSTGAQEDDSTERDKHGARDRQSRPHGWLDVGQVSVGQAETQRQRAEGEDDAGLGLLVHPGSAHRNHHPTIVAQAIATMKVAGAKRRANDRPKVPAWRAVSFTSTAGPTTMKASRAVGENCTRLAATNASASEHTASSTASRPSVSTAPTPEPPRLSSSDRGTTT